MTTIVTRLYADSAKAEAAAAALRKSGFSADRVGLVTGGGDALAAIRALGVYEAGAQVYAAHVKDGAALVVAHAPFAKSYKAREILDSHGPMPANVKYSEVYVPAKDPPPRSKRRYSSPPRLDSNNLALSDGIFPPAIIRNHRPFASIIENYRSRTRLINGTITGGIIPLLSGRSPRGGIMNGPVLGFLPQLIRK
jgi:hypothetical protein